MDNFVCTLWAQFSLSLFSRLFGGRGRLRGTHSPAFPTSPVLWVQARHADSAVGSPNLLPVQPLTISPHSVLRVTRIHPVLFRMGSPVPLPSYRQPTSSAQPVADTPPVSRPPDDRDEAERRQERAVSACRLMVCDAVNFIATYLRRQK